MIGQLPAWIQLPSHSIRQTETFRQWHALIRERIIQNPPRFLSHLSSLEIRETLAAAEKVSVMPNAKLTPLLVQILAYERQAELIAWSHFIAMGEKLISLRKKLTQLEFEETLEQTGVTHEEAEVSMAAARQEAA